MCYNITMLRVLSIPTDLDPGAFLPLMRQCAQMFNAHVDWALANHTYSKTKAHHALYSHLRQSYPEIPSPLIQTMRDTALESLKAAKSQRPPRKKDASAVRYDKRTMALRGDQLTLACIGKRAKTILRIPRYFRPVFDTWQFKGGRIMYKPRRKQMWVQLVFGCPAPRRAGGDIMGIDRGLYHSAVTSKGRVYSNNKVRAVQRRYLYNVRTLQAKGTRSAKRRLKAMSGKEQRFSQDANHIVTKSLAQEQDTAVFVLEDLSGLHNARRGKKMNKWLGSWSFRQFERVLTYKAEALGKEVAYVDAHYTSQKCSRCGYTHRSNRDHSRFLCCHCGFRCHADVNAAVNIRNAYILSTTPSVSVEQAAVDQPYVTSFGSVTSCRPSGGDSRHYI